MKSKRARDAVEDKHVDAVDVEAPAKKRKRSDEDADVKKAKKDKKSKKHKQESRKERKDKRKDLQDLPEQEDDDENPAGTNTVEEDSPMADAVSKPAADSADAAAEEKAARKAAKKAKKEKKEKKAKDEDKPQDAPVTPDSEVKDSSKDSSKDKKKSKKDKKKSSKESNDTTADADADDGADDANASSDKADRHIVFVGNLPFTATATTIEAHFASLSPVSVRCMSDPNDSKPCRGFAFVEFAKVWHMRTCLDKFHHSMFEDGVSPARRINVELTAGGGGKTQQRQDKIKEKNRKLDENRTKRIEREKTAKTENKANGNSNTQQHMEDSVHPSRRAHVPSN